jgi:molybdopterin-containing oxidoreductase family iron-sulfur binding subunit
MSDHHGKRLPLLGSHEGQGEARPEGGSYEVSRRQFLSLMGASIALAGMTACTRQPPEEIVPYVKQPEEITPGKSLFYATAMVHAGYATGLLVRSYSGRPVKIEGNPDHPASLGATDAFAQASILTLYDPARAQVVTRHGRISTFPRFIEEIGAALAAEKAGGGAGIRILTEAVTSPSLADQIQGFLAENPNAKWHRYEPAGNHNAAAGARLAFGAPVEARYDLARADVILTLDSDLLAYGPGALRYARDFSARRAAGVPSAPEFERATSPAAQRMNRLYCVESSMTCTGSLADHRLAVRPSEVATFAAAVAAELGVPGVERPAAGGSPSITNTNTKWAAAVAKDLRASAGRSLVVAGEHASPAVHALAAAMNEALQNVGATVVYTDPVEAAPVDHIASIRELAEDLRAGRVSLLVILGGNPVYTAPIDIGFAEAMRAAKVRVHLSLYSDETSELCHYHIPEAHYLEAWGDARAFDGTVSIIQPLILPLYGGKSAIELVAALRGQASAAGIELVRAYWRGKLDPARFEATYRKALRDGVIEGTALPPRPAALLPDAAPRAAADIAARPPGGPGYEIAIRPDPTIDDGRFWWNGWLQELPKPNTKLTWDNAAIMSPKTAAEIGVGHEDVVELAREGRSVRAAVTVLPGHPEGTVTAYLGYGRARPGAAASGNGFNAYLLRTSGALSHGQGLSIQKTGARYNLSETQRHFNLEGRPHARSATFDVFSKDPSMIREMSHVPPRDLSLYPEWPYPGYAWGMVVDLGACTGCSACVVACQSENNIPVVGKSEVERSREMHWLRIDRYYEDSAEDPEILNQPMMCVHCEMAPCEYVCPVGATTHSAEGLNEMTYNRCIGTRYCSNNCPYKVRRFNFLEYNDNTSKVRRLQRNPDVTVRSRGVMEKCTYCVQRINTARIDAEREGRRIRDGEVRTACQDACPTGAIVFGDVNDPSSRVRRLKEDLRSYGVLAELNTRPRTTYLAKIRNPNPELSGGSHG